MNSVVHDHLPQLSCSSVVTVLLFGIGIQRRLYDLVRLLKAPIYELTPP